jgi:hypothetical protein
MRAEPAGLNLERSYDSLSFVPTMLRLVGRDEAAFAREGDNMEP